MRPGGPTLVAEERDELSALIDTLTTTERRLEELTAGEVDTVVDRDGRTFLLHRAQETLRHTRSARQAAILNALPAHIALLDPQGMIVSVNEAWRTFAGANQMHGPEHAVGVNYLRVCDAARGDFSAEAGEVASGIRAVLAGESRSFSIEYPCHSPNEQRWFLLTVTPLADELRNGAVVMHLDISERRLAEQALEKLSQTTSRRERMLNTTLSSITDFAYIFDREGRFLFANQPLLDLWGIELEAAVGKDFFELGYPTELAVRLHQQVQEVFDTRKSVTGETPYTNPAGLEGSYEYIFSPIVADDGSVESVAGSTRDITERKSAEAALRASTRELEIERSRLLTAQRVAKIGSWETDLTTMSVIWSEETHRIHGTDAATFAVTHDIFLSFVHPDDRVKVDGAFRRSLKEGAPSAIEHRLLLPDGRIKFVEERWQVLFDEQGKPLRAIGTCQDITERMHGEARSRLQAEALNASANAMVITERDFRVVWINPAFTELTGYRDEDALGTVVTDLLNSGLHEKAFYESIRATIERGQSWSGEMTNRRRDGSFYPEALTITPVKDEDGAITHFISISTDLTARRHMEDQLRQAQKMDAVGKLAAGVAHEFNNLLQALMSMATITRVRAINPDVAKIGSEMENQIKRGASLTQQLLVFSQQQTMQKVDFDVREHVERASTLLRRLIPENIRMVVEIAPERLSIEGDAGQMQQVLLNLAINARDAMPEGGPLTIRTGCMHGEVFIEVEDGGHGMDEATRARIFEPFFTTKEIGKGTGLGLAVVYGIVEQHGGRIEVHSRPGEGSRFRVILPAVFRESLPLPEATVESTDCPIGSGSILLVEDEEAVREGITMLLETIGYDVTAVGSAEEALALHSERPPDILLSDITLPGLAGSALGDRLRDRWPSLRVVLMSGYGEIESRDGQGEHGWHFLQKPFDMSELAEHLQAALDTRIFRSLPAITEIARL